MKQNVFSLCAQLIQVAASTYSTYSHVSVISVSHKEMFLSKQIKPLRYCYRATKWNYSFTYILDAITAHKLTDDPKKAISRPASLLYIIITTQTKEQTVIVRAVMWLMWFMVQSGLLLGCIYSDCFAENLLISSL